MDMLIHINLSLHKLPLRQMTVDVSCVHTTVPSTKNAFPLPFFAFPLYLRLALLSPKHCKLLLLELSCFNFTLSAFDLHVSAKVFLLCYLNSNSINNFQINDSSEGKQVKVAKGLEGTLIQD